MYLIETRDHKGPYLKNHRNYEAAASDYVGFL